MYLIPFLFASLAAAASFTAEGAYGVKASDFSNYQGNREILQRIIDLSGSIAKDFPRDAKCLDDILVEDHLIFLVNTASYCDDFGHVGNVGELIGELSPERFDSLCFKLGDYSAGSLSSGYSNKESRWKKSSELAIDAPITEENANYHKGYYSPNYCDFMMSRPADILTSYARNNCIQTWRSTKQHGVVRQLIKEMKYLDLIPAWAFDAFEGHEAELVEWLKKAILDGRLLQVRHFKIPKTLLQPHRWEEICQFLEANQIPFGPQFSHLGTRNLIVNECFEGVYNTVSIGFDRETFMDQWVMAKPSITPNEILNLKRGYPMPLKEAIRLAISYDLWTSLENTLTLISHYDPQYDLEPTFWDCIHNDFNYILVETKIPRFRKLFTRLKPHLTRVEHRNFLSWHYLPLFRDMCDHPDFYWPEGLKEKGMNWAQEQMIAKIPQTESQAIEKAMSQRNSSLLLYGIQQGWKDAFKAGCGMSTWDALDGMLDHEALSVISERIGFPLVKEAMQKTTSHAWPVLAGIALSSNFKLLDFHIDIYGPKFLLDNCHTSGFKRRISLMLHLSPKITSYTKDGTPIDKNSTLFRDWVLLRLWTRNTADLKLLYYYFDNLVSHRYEHFEIEAIGRVMGLYPYTPHDPACLEDLLLEPLADIAQDLRDLSST